MAKSEKLKNGGLSVQNCIKIGRLLFVFVLTFSVFTSCGGLVIQNPFTVANGKIFFTEPSIEMAIPVDYFGGLGHKHFEPIFYQSDSSELDYTGSLEGDLSALPSASITIDGSFSDWGGISPFLTDPTGDQIMSVAGADLTDFVMAQDGTNLYVGFGLSDNSPNTNNLYVLHMGDNAGFGWGSQGFAVMHDGTKWVGTTNKLSIDDGQSFEVAVSSDSNSASDRLRYLAASGSISGLQIQIDADFARLSGSPIHFRSISTCRF